MSSGQDEIITCLEVCAEQLEKLLPYLKAEPFKTPREVEAVESAIQWSTALAESLRSDQAKRELT